MDFSGYFPKKQSTDNGTTFGITETERLINNFVKTQNEQNGNLSTVLINFSPTTENPNDIKTRDILLHLGDVNISARNVFFIESRCATETLSKQVTSSGIILNPRQSCAVESTALTNPGRDIYVLHTCPVGNGDFLLESPEYIRRLLSVPNVRLVTYNVTEMFSNTPVEGLVARKGLEGSSFPVEHASDVLRLTMLWKFGGTYLDMDVVTIKSLDELKSNFCGLESDYNIGNAVMNFEPEGVGHDMMTAALQHVNDHFDGSRWTANGPDLVTHLVLKTCNVTFKDLTTSCTRFTVFNHTFLYPVYWWDHAQLFDDKMGPGLVESFKRSAYVVHAWNRLSHSNKISVGSSSAYGLLADEFCPKVYRNCGDFF